MNKLTWLSLLFVLIAGSAFAEYETTHLRIDSYSMKSHSYNYNKHTYDISGFDTSPAHAFDMTNLYAVEVDREYAVIVSLLGPDDRYDPGDHTVTLHFHVPDGYTVLLGDYEASVYNAVDDVWYFTFTITRKLSLGAGVSTNPTIVDFFQFHMDFGLGNLANGAAVYPLRLRAGIDFLTNGIEDVIEVSSISFIRPYGNVWAVKQYSGGNLVGMQIKKPDVVVSITNPASNTMQISFYKRADMIGTLASNSSGTWMNPIEGAEPFRRYLFTLESAFLLRVEEFIGSFVRETEIEKPNYYSTWNITQKDAGGTEYIRTLHHYETVGSIDKKYSAVQRKSGSNWITDYLTCTDTESWTQNNVSVRKVVRVWKDPAFSTAKGQIAANPNGKNYLTQQKYDTYGRLLWTIDQQGSWRITDYVPTPSDPSYSRPWRIRRPFEDGMAFDYTAGSGWSPKSNYSTEPHILEEMTYGATVGSWPARIIGDYPLKRETFHLPGSHRRSLTDYAYSEVTRNGKPVLVSSATSYANINPASEARTTTTASYWNWMAGTDTLFVGLPYAVTLPEGTRTVYVHQKGNLSGTSFTPSASGYAWREVSFTGKTTYQSGSTVLSLPSAEFAQGGVLPQVETLFLMQHRSEKNVRIRDEGGNLVYGARYVWGNDNGTFKWIFAGSTTYAYNPAGQRTGSVSSNGSTYTAYYDFDGFLEKEIFSDGREVVYSYDGIGRLYTKTEKGVSGVAGGVDRTTTYKYNARSQVLSESKTYTGSSEKLFAVMEYDRAGNIRRQRSVNNHGTEYVLTQATNSPLIVSRSIKNFENATNTSGVFTTSPVYYRQIHESWYRDGNPRRVWGDVVEPVQYKSWFNTSSQRIEKSILYGNEADLTANTSWTNAMPEDKKWVTHTYNAMNELIGSVSPARTVSSGTDNLTVDAYNYTADGKVFKFSRTGKPTYHYVHDPMGVLVMEGEDVNSSSSLTTNSTDRVTEYVLEYYINWASEPTQKVETRTYDDVNQPIILNRRETKLDGFGSSERSSVVETAVAHHPNAWQEVGAVVSQRHEYPGSSETLTFQEMWFDSQPAWKEDSKAKNGFVVEQRTAAIEADGSEPVRYTYDGFGRRESVEDTRGYLKTFEYYPGTTQVAKIYGMDAGGSLQLLSEYEYCGCGGKVAKETIHHGLDSNNQPITSEISYVYYPNGLLKTQDGNGTMPARYAYNDHGQPTDMWQFPDGTISYDDAVGSRTRWTYWGNGLLHKKIDAQNRETVHTYDSFGRLYRIATPRESGATVTQTFAYQSSGLRLLSGISYSGVSSIVNNTPAKGYTYDRLGRMKTVTHTYPSSVATEFGITASQTWTWHYNVDTQNTDSIAYGRLSHIQMPDMYGTGTSVRKMEYGYEPGMGLVGRRQLKAGTTSEWRQDWSFWADGRPEEIVADERVFILDWEPGTGFMSSADVETNNSRTVTRTRQLEEHRPFLEAEQISISGPGTVVSSAFYNRDRQGRIADRHLSGTQFSGYGQYNSHTTFYNYNLQGELTEENAWANGDANPMMDRHRSYHYDRAGNRDSKREVYAGISSNGSNSDNATHVYLPNNLNQYTGVTRSQQWETISGKYDPATDPNLSGTTEWVYQQSNNTWWYAYPTASNSSGQYAWAAPLDIAGSDTGTSWRAYYEDMSNGWLEKYFPPKSRSPAHDEAGNMTDDGYLTYVYDAENRLVEVADGHMTWKFLYDPFGRRIRQKLSGWYFSYYSQDWTNELLYHSQLVYDEWHPILEQVLGGQSTSHRYKYYWGPDISGSYGGAGGIGGLLMMHRSNINKSYTVGYDGNGNVLNMIDLSDGSVDATFEYDAFGQIVRETGDSWRMPFRYQTKWSSAYAPTSKLMGGSTATMAAPRIKIDLYDYGLRWYHPNFGRFVNRDPIGEAGGINLYAFTSNDPVNKWDMLGMDDLGYIHELKNFYVYGEEVIYSPEEVCSRIQAISPSSEDRTFVGFDDNDKVIWVIDCPGVRPPPEAEDSDPRPGDGDGDVGEGNPGPGSPPPPQGKQDWSKEDCDNLADQIDNKNKLFNEASNALREDLQFQQDSNSILYGVDRAVDIGTSLFAGAAFKIGSGIANAWRSARAVSRLNPVVSGPGASTMWAGESGYSLSGQLASYSAPLALWGGEQAAGYAAGRPFAWGTTSVRDEIDNLINSSENYVEQLSQDLNQKRKDFSENCK